jgi:hypothetical protein
MLPRPVRAKRLGGSYSAAAVRAGTTSLTRQRGHRGDR